MPAHRSHGSPYVEAPRHDELPDGEPADASEQRAASQERRAGGNRIAPGSKLVPAMGGRSHKNSTRLTHQVPATLPVPDKLRARARFARKKVCSEWARTVGRGQCGIVASLLAKLGVEDMAMREAAMAEGKVDLARRLGESARMHLIYGREVCAKDGQALKILGGKDPSGKDLPSYIEVVPDGQEEPKE